MAKILEVSKSGLVVYSKGNWPEIAGVTPEQIHSRLFTGPPTEKQSHTISELKEPVMRLFHSVASKIVLPRAQGRMDVRVMDAVIIYCLMEKIKLSLPALVLSHMVACLERTKHSLPYGGWLTLVFQKFDVGLRGEFRKMTMMSNRIIGRKGMAFEEGVLKMKDGQVFHAQGRGTSSGAGEASSSLAMEMRAQSEMMRQMMASVNALCASLDGSFQRINARLDDHEKLLPSTSQKIIPRQDGADEEKESDEDDNTNSSTI